jgi:hypothetical protein
MRAYRSGTVSSAGAASVGVRTWTDGRSWVKLRVTHGWAGGALFGDLGDVVRRVRVGAAGVAYVGEQGDRVALHGRGVDAVVEGSVPVADLLAVAESLGIAGREVPASWAHAGADSLAVARTLVPELLVAPRLSGFRVPGVRVENGVVVLDYAGSGARAFRLTDAPGGTLVPPLDPDVRGVVVRGTVGRYQPASGELEWVEAGRTLSLRSTSLSLRELLGIAARLEP